MAIALHGAGPAALYRGISARQFQQSGQTRRYGCRGGRGTAAACRPDSQLAVPWARAYRITQTTPDTAIFPTTIRNSQRQPLFKWVGPIILAHDNFYALRGSGIVIRDSKKLAAFRDIAAPRDWFSYQELQAAGMKNLLGVNEPVQMFSLLRSGRVPLIVADNLSFYARGEAAEQVDHLRPDEIEVAFPYRDSYGYITFSLDTDDALIRRWQDALDDMKRDGSFSRIHQHWLPGAEVPGLREPERPGAPQTP